MAFGFLAPAAASMFKGMQLPGQSGKPGAMARPAQTPRVNQPTAPTVSTKPVGRPPSPSGGGLFGRLGAKIAQNPAMAGKFKQAGAAGGGGGLLGKLAGSIPGAQYQPAAGGGGGLFGGLTQAAVKMAQDKGIDLRKAAAGGEAWDGQATLSQATGAGTPGSAAAQRQAASPAGAAAYAQQAAGTGANRNPMLAKAAANFIKAGADLSPTQREGLQKTLAGTDIGPAPGAAGVPGQVTQAPAPTTTTTMPAGASAPAAPQAGPAGAAPPPPGPASQGAPNAPAPAEGATPTVAGGPGTAAQGQQAPAAPIGTPQTAASQPLKDSPWAYEKKWGALGALGDQDVDAAVKAQTLENMQNNPFSENAQQIEAGRIREQGLLGAQGAEAQMKADLARRGITGPAAAQMIAEQNMAARQNISQQQRESQLEMTKQQAEYNLNSTAQGQQLGAELAKRGVDLESLRMNREQLAQQLAAQKRRGGGGGGGEQMLEVVNPDGSVSQVPMGMAMMALDLMEGGYE
jgi:hypothetical protein